MQDGSNIVVTVTSSTELENARVRLTIDGVERELSDDGTLTIEVGEAAGDISAYLTADNLHEAVSKTVEYEYWEMHF